MRCQFLGGWMGSVYDQEQTKGIQEINKELKSSSKINKWILAIAVITLIAVIIQIIISLIKR